MHYSNSKGKSLQKFTHRVLSFVMAFVLVFAPAGLSVNTSAAEPSETNTEASSDEGVYPSTNPIVIDVLNPESRNNTTAMGHHPAPSIIDVNIGKETIEVEEHSINLNISDIIVGESKELVVNTMVFFTPDEEENGEDVDIDEEIEEILDGFVYCPDIELSEELQRYTYQRCQELDIEYELVLALMWRESRFTVNAVGYNSWNGTYDNGLMQINDCNRGWLREQHGITDLMDPYQNIDAGTFIIAEFIHKHGETQGLMAYQYGEGGMKSKAAQGIYTNSSVQNLQLKRNEFKGLIQAV